AAASADPTFIRPLDEPEYRGAISMGIAQNGPIVNSAKKNAAARQRATKFSWCSFTKGKSAASDVAFKTGIMSTNESRKQMMMMCGRVWLGPRVGRRTEPLATPPSVLPIAPRMYTPLAEMAACFRSSLYVFRKKEGNQVRKSHKVHP